MVFVADEIPAELRRIIEFLNGQMDPAEVLGVEVRQYLGAQGTVMVPKVVGLTAQAQQAKSPTPTVVWDRASFLSRLGQQRSEGEARVAERMLAWCDERMLDLKWGRGAKTGSFSPKLFITAPLMGL